MDTTNAASTASADPLTLLSTDDLLDRLRNAIAAVHPDTATEAEQMFAALDTALAQGAALPQRWASQTASRTPATGQPEVPQIHLDADGNLAVTTTVVTETATFETENQIGFDFSAPATTQTIAQTVRFPKPKSRRGTPRRNAPATVVRPLDAPSLFESAMPVVGLHHPSTAHQAIKHTTQASARAKHLQMFWMVVDAGSRGLCVFEALARLEHTEVGVHHGAVSGRMNWLMNNGFVEDSGLRRRTPKNRPAIAWRVTAHARQRIMLGYEKRPAGLLLPPSLPTSEVPEIGSTAVPAPSPAASPDRTPDRTPDTTPEVAPAAADAPASPGHPEAA